jgi:hypothetical protein
MVSESTTNYITVTIEKTGRDMVSGVPFMVTCGTLGSHEWAQSWGVRQPLLA